MPYKCYLSNETIFLGCASVQIELRLLTSDILTVLKLTYHLQRPIKHSIIFFKLNHYSFTGVTLTDTCVREELSLDAYRKGFQFIHVQFWSLGSSCLLAFCYFYFTFISHNSRREKHTQWRKRSQAGQPAKT